MMVDERLAKIESDVEVIKTHVFYIKERMCKDGEQFALKNEVTTLKKINSGFFVALMAVVGWFIAHLSIK